MTSGGGGVVTDEQAVARHVALRDMRRSDGVEVKRGDRIRIHYQIAISESEATSEQWIEDSWPVDRPVEFRVGDGEVLAGIDFGVVGMRLASYRMVTIASPAALGSRGAANRVPPDATLWCKLYVADVIGS